MMFYISCKLKLFLHVLFFSALTAPLNLYAAIVSIEGDNYIFTYDNSTLFGSANVINDSIFFLPTDFSAHSVNNEGAVLTSDIVDIAIQTKSGSSKLIDAFSIYELGDYRLHGDSASVDVAAYVQVSSFTATCNNFFLMPCITSQTFSPEETFTTTDPLVDLNTLVTWQISGEIDLDSHPDWGSDSYVNLRIQNNLYATSLNIGDLAQIQKKFGGLGVQVVSEVPLPTAFWLFASALIGLRLSKKQLSI